MQKWPYVNFGYLNVEQFRKPQKNDPPQKREYLTVEAVFVPASENVMFFEHYTKGYKGQKSELDEYLEKLGADGWKLTFAGNLYEGRGYQFRRYHFRRAVQ
jgi:hypothetical protein